MLVEENIRRIAGVETPRNQTISKNDVRELLTILKDVNLLSIEHWRKVLKAVSNGGTIEVKS